MITQAARGHKLGAGAEQKPIASPLRDDQGWGAMEGKKWMHKAWREGGTHRAW